MASYCVHVAHGLETLIRFKKRIVSDKAKSKKYLKTLKIISKESYEAIIEGKDNSWKKQFMAGLVLPDAAKISPIVNPDYHDRISHFARDLESYFKTPDLERFLMEHPISLNDPLYLGYAIHLYMDILFDNYLKGKYSFRPFDDKSDICVKYVDSAKKTVILSSKDFWNKMYEDYSKLNPYYIKKYKVTIDGFAVDIDIDTQNAVQIMWYAELHKVIKSILEDAADVIKGNEINEQINKLELLDNEFVLRLITMAANDFVENYLIPLLHSNSSKRYLKADKTQWKAESVKLQYYKAKWNRLLTDKCLSNTEKGFFDGVLEEITDVTRNAQRHRKIYSMITFFLCFIPISVTVFSALSTAMNNTSFQCSFVFSIVSTALSAILTAIIQYDEKTTHKDTWLRQRLYYSMLMNETERFCERIDKYEKLRDESAIIEYMDSIRQLRNKDYENFFLNMGCSNFKKE